MVAGGFMPLESMIADQAMAAAGNPIFLGLLLLGTFLGIAIVQNTRLDVKVFAFTGGAILAACYMPFIALFIGLVAGTLVYFALMKIIAK